MPSGPTGPRSSPPPRRRGPETLPGSPRRPRSRRPPPRAGAAEPPPPPPDDVGLKPPEQFYGRLSTEISGGQKQRAVIARALAPRPLLLVADGPGAPLDTGI